MARKIGDSVWFLSSAFGDRLLGIVLDRYNLSLLELSFGICGSIKGAVSRNSVKLGNYKMPVKLRET